MSKARKQRMIDATAQAMQGLYKIREITDSNPITPETFLQIGEALKLSKKYVSLMKRREKEKTNE